MEVTNWINRFSRILTNQGINLWALEIRQVVLHRPQFLFREEWLRNDLSKPDVYSRNR